MNRSGFGSGEHTSNIVVEDMLSPVEDWPRAFGSRRVPRTRDRSGGGETVRSSFIACRGVGSVNRLRSGAKHELLSLL
jgi:hypothetical protein